MRRLNGLTQALNKLQGRDGVKAAKTQKRHLMNAFRKPAAANSSASLRESCGRAPLHIGGSCAEQRGTPCAVARGFPGASV